MAFVVLTPIRTTSSTTNRVVKESIHRTNFELGRNRRAKMTGSAVIEKGAGMRIIKQADESTISKFGCRSWSTWGCGPSTFPWTYSDDEVCLVLEGDFTVIPDDGSQSMGMFSILNAFHRYISFCIICRAATNYFRLTFISTLTF